MMRTKLHLTLWLIALLLGLMGSASHARGQTSGNFGEGNALKWEYDNVTRTLTISGQGEMPDYSNSKDSAQRLVPDFLGGR